MRIMTIVREKTGDPVGVTHTILAHSPGECRDQNLGKRKTGRKARYRTDTGRNARRGLSRFSQANDSRSLVNKCHNALPRLIHPRDTATVKTEIGIVVVAVPQMATGAVETVNHATTIMTETEKSRSGTDGETTTTTITRTTTTDEEERTETTTGGEGEMTMTMGNREGTTAAETADAQTMTTARGGRTTVTVTVPATG